MTNPMSHTSLFHADGPRDDIQRGRGGNSLSPNRRDRPLGTAGQPAGHAPASHVPELAEATAGAHRHPHAADGPLPLAARLLLWLAAAVVCGGLVVAWIH